MAGKQSSSGSVLLENGQTEYSSVMCPLEPRQTHFCQQCTDRRVTNTATGYCLQCEEYLCRRCSSIHCEPKPSRHHQVIGVESADTFVKGELLRDGSSEGDQPSSEVDTSSSDGDEPTCPEHTKNPAQYYCRNHEVFRCSVCITLYHRRCDRVVWVPDEADKIDSNKDFLDMQTKLRDYQDRVLNIERTMETGKSRMEALRTEQRESFNVLYRRIIDVLDSTKALGLKDFEKVEEENVGSMKQCNDKIKSIKSELETMNANVHELHAQKRNDALFRTVIQSKTILSGLDTRMDELMECTFSKVFSFVPSAGIETFFGELTKLGHVEIADSSITLSSQLVKANGHPKRESCDSIKTKSRDEINVRLADDVEPNYITGMTMLSDNTLAIVDANNPSIRIVDCKTKCVRCNVKLTGKPWDVTEVSPSMLAVTMPTMSSVRLIERTETGLSLGYRIDVIGRCHGIAFIDGTFVLSCVGDQDFILLMTQTGDVLKTIMIDEGQGHPELDQSQSIFSSPLYVRSIPGREIFLVSNTIGNNILCMNLEGELVAVYDSPELIRPKGIAILSDGRIYVKCDSMTVAIPGGNSDVSPFCTNQNCPEVSRSVIYQIDPEDHKAREVVMEDCGDHLQSPIAVTRDAQTVFLYVCSQRSGVIKVFELDT